MLPVLVRSLYRQVTTDYILPGYFSDVRFYKVTAGFTLYSSYRHEPVAHKVLHKQVPADYTLQQAGANGTQLRKQVPAEFSIQA